MREQHAGAGRDDKEHDDIAQEHAGPDIDPHLADGPFVGTLALLDGRLADGDLFFYLLRGLPKEQIWRDGGTKDGTNYQQLLLVESDMWRDSLSDDGVPIRPGQDSGQNVGEQH